MIKFDKNKCIQCGLCVKACPFTILELENNYPAMGKEKKDLCIRCFHCISICRNKAVSAEGVEGIDVKIEKAPSSIYGEGAAEKLIKGRRSVRKYNKRKVDREIIENILQAAEWAPSAKNQHPVKWLAVCGKEKTDKIMEMVLDWVKEAGREQLILSEYSNGNNIVTFGAPYLLFAYADTAAVNPFADSVIAMTMADLMFYEKGISTCWGGYMTRIANNSQAIRKYLNLPENCQIYAVLGFGYTDIEQYTYLPYRKDAQITWL